MGKHLLQQTLLVLVLLIAGVGAACERSAADSSSAPKAGETLKRKPEGHLRVAVGYLGTEAMDPSLGEAGHIKMLPLYDFLVGVTPDGNLSKDTGLAEKWEVSHSQGKSTYTIWLRKGIKFHNGDELTSKDVKFTLEHFNRPESIASGVTEVRDTIADIEVPDAGRVVIHTKQPYGFLLLDLSRVGMAHGMMLPSKYIQEKGLEQFNKQPVGTGPYRFKEQKQGSHMTFEALDDHWLIGVPKYKFVTYQLVTEESTRISMLKAGEVDVIDVSRERAKELSDFSLFEKPGSELVEMWLGNTFQKDTYLSDQRVREALNLAINREEILKYIFEGKGSVTGSSSYGSWALGYRPMPLYVYDPERAKKLLNEAFPRGVELTLYSYARPGISELPRMNEAVAGQWQAVGVKVSIRPSDYPTFRGLLRKGAASNTLAGMSVSNRPINLAFWGTMYSSGGAVMVAQMPELDALMDRARKEVDFDKFAERQYEVAKYIREHHISVPILEVSALFAARRSITQWNLGKLPFDNNFVDLWQQK